MNSMAHYKDVKQLTGIIDSYEKKLDDKVNQMYNHIINISNSINETSLPIIENKRISSQINYKQSNFVKRKTRAQSIGSKSFVVNNDTTINQEVTQADYLFKTFKDKMEKSAKQKKNENSLIIPLGTRAMGGQVYVKPKILRKKPQILSKQMRWDPFYEKNAIKAQQLKEGMLSLIQKGKVGKNIDIITAFQKGRPILQTHQAIFHHAEQKFTDNELMKSQINPSQKTIKRQVQEANYNRRRNLIPTQQDGNTTQLNNHANNSWAITIPEDSNFKFDESKNLKKNTYLGQQIGQLYCIQFLHYKLKKDQNFDKMKKFYKFHQNWGQVMEIINQMQRNLKLYNIDLVYCSGNKILQLAKRRYSLSRIQINDLQECLIKNQKQQGCKKRKFFNLLSMNNKQSKRDLATAIVTSAFLYTLIRNKYMTILRRKKYQNKIKQWILNGRIIKEYRRELQKSRKQILKKFQQQQKHFRSNFASIQQKKHFQIHIVNRQYMNKFKYFQEYCCTEITRIFNLENNNTNIIYVSPFQLNVQTINYYFKIMELEQIENYSERVTFLELQDITSKIKLPMSMNTSQKLYFNSKALRKLKRKIQRMPAYFVTNYPSQIDIKLSVYLGIPIYSGDFYQINPIRSLLNSEKFSFEGIESTPCLPINPKQFNVFQLSNYIIKYCEANKKCRKYVIKINNHHFSSGLALLAYPFNSLHEMYGCTALIQPYYFRSIEKFYSELVRQGGVIQKYEEGTKTIAISAKISENQQYSILGTFQRISIGFVNVGYVFPQKIISHKTLISKCDQILQRLASLGHLGYVQLTINVNIQQQIYLQQIQLYSTKITNSLYYFKFLAGGYLNNFGQFMTKVSAEGEEDEQLASMQSRSYCYIPFILHYGLSEKQTGSFFQLCRIGGISFDLQSKYGTTFIILGSLKNTVGIITTAKDKKNILKLVSKSTQFLMKQNSHNISTQMLKQKQQRAKERFSINSIKDKIQQL